ncbi:MAG: hypothetical protein K0R55_951, partial [Sporomusa sp.]|nr:hypothetical protein [Sporomusa sp.]
MSILRMGSWIISRSSPAVLIASGAALALAVPAVRRGFRAALVTATKGALVISDEVKNLTEKVRVGASDIVEEARQTSCCPCPAIKSLRSSAKVKGRRMAVATTAGVLSIQEKAKS